MILGRKAPIVAAAGGGVTINGGTFTKQYQSANTTLFSYTGCTIAAGTHIALVVAISWDISSGASSPTDLAMTWNGVGLTLIKAGNNSGLGANAELWGLVNPATVSQAPDQTLAMSWTNNARAFVIGAAFDGVDQTGGATSFPGSTSGTSVTTVAVTSAVGDKVMACAATGSAIAGITGTTLYQDSATGLFINAYANYDNGAASVNIGQSNPQTQIVATSIKAG